MDERDKEWLDRNNEEARGEGTSAQGAVSPSTGRTSTRSAKAKGKEPEEAQPIIMNEDEFELVMGLFEKITQEKTEFLHHVRRPSISRTLILIVPLQSLESGQMHFPEFSEYQEVLSAPLPPSTFAPAKHNGYLSIKAVDLERGKSADLFRVAQEKWQERLELWPRERGTHDLPDALMLLACIDVAMSARES